MALHSKLTAVAAVVLIVCLFSSSTAWGFVQSPRSQSLTSLGPMRFRNSFAVSSFSFQSKREISMGLFPSIWKGKSVGSVFHPHREQPKLGWSRLRQVAVCVGRSLLPLLLPVFLVYVLGVPPAMAKGKRGKKTSIAMEAAATAGAAAGAVAAAESTVAVVKKRSLFRKILQGVNADGASILRGAGDTRGDFAAILNAFSSFFILGGMFFVAFLVHKQREVRMEKAMVQEVEKIREYKENMYFEAVQLALEKLADPKLKGSTKANLQKQLKDLDPDGVIRKFLEEKGERPDISYLIDRKKRKPKKDDKFSAIAERKPPKKKPSSSPSSSLSKKGDSTEDFSDNGDDDDQHSARPLSSSSDEQDALPPSPTPSPARNTDREQPRPAKQPAHITVLAELSESLEGALTDSARTQLLELLRGKIEAVSDPAKRDGVVAKIAQRLGDEEYWQQYYASNFQ